MKLERRAFLCGAGLSAAMPMLAAARSAGRNAEETPLLSMTVLNTDCMSGGVGQCCVFRTASGKTYLYDTGNAEPHRPELKKNNGNIPWVIKAGRECLADYVDGGIRRMFVTNIHGDVTVETDGKCLTVLTDPNALMEYDPK